MQPVRVGYCALMPSKVTKSPGAPTDWQAEVDLLRGQLGPLNIADVWTLKTAPKLTGPYGLFLQGLDAGESLIRAFTRLHIASEAARTNAYTILTIVEAKIRQLENPPKRKGK